AARRAGVSSSPVARAIARSQSTALRDGPMRVAERAGAAGFTLIEVLVALAVVGMAMAAMAGVFSNGLLGHETAAGAEEALAVAEERLALAAAGPAFAPGIAKGTFADRFAWQTTVAPY